MFNTDDPLSDFRRKEAEEFLWLQSRPICFECGDPIVEDFLYEFNGYCYCERCVENHKERIDD